MKNNHLHLIACLLLFMSGGRSIAQGSTKPDTLFNKPYVDAEEWRDKPGTYFTTLRAVSQRQGDAKTPFARI